MADNLPPPSACAPVADRPVSFTELRKLALSICNRPRLLAVLQRFGVSRLNELQPSSYPAAYRILKGV